MRSAWLVVATVLFLLTVPLANWMIGNVGHCIPNGPCLVPVWPGIMAPSGVLVIGLALALRDTVHEALGAWVTAFLVLAAAAMSAAFAPSQIVVASAIAFLVSELADLGVYAPLRSHGLEWAVVASGIVGAFVDSMLFLWLAFGSLEFVAGQVVGKVEMTLAAAAVLYGWRKLEAIG